MERFNVVGFESPFGYKTLELLHGDLTRMDARVDLMVISLFQRDYLPTPNSLVEAFDNSFDSTVAELRHGTPLDLSEGLGLWISSELASGSTRRILGLEMEGTGVDLSDALDNLFAGVTLFGAKKIPVESVAMPLIATGYQAVDPEEVMEEFLERVEPFLVQSPHTNRLLIVEIDRKKAELLSEGMNTVLKRPDIGLPRTDLIDGVRSGIVNALDRAWTDLPAQYRDLIGDVRGTLNRPDPKSYEIGVAFRRIAEAVTRAALPDDAAPNLYQKIEQLHKHGYAKWIITYLHVLRVFGNEAAHESAPQTPQTPVAVQDADLVVCLVCGHRILEFWLEELT